MRGEIYEEVLRDADGESRWCKMGRIFQFLDMSEEQLKASLDAEGAKPLEEGADVELTDEELDNVAGGATSWFDLDSDFGEVNPLVG
ncbi:MAG: hypothetical protein NTV57_16780 [Cyanobacteria bacterium]|nr:hypothetical protein [Cyanobacteriota bacterium]